jgi:hypothetical protein
MTSNTARANLRNKDAEIISTAVPAHMMLLMVEQCQKVGVDVRLDVMKHLVNAVVAPLARCDSATVSRLTRRIDDTATTLLHDLSPDDPRHGLYCCAMFCMKLVDEKRFPDARNQAVLVSMLLMDDIKDDRPDVNGELPVWRLQEASWIAEANRLIGRANLLGLYLKDDLVPQVQDAL